MVFRRLSVWYRLLEILFVFDPEEDTGNKGDHTEILLILV
jgi:hypothetical protein